MLKKFALTLVCVLALPITALAANIQSGESLNITEQQKNSYLFGSTVNVKAETKGDLTVFANDVFVDEKVERSMIAAGATVRTNAPIEQSAKIFAGTANFDEKVGEDLIVFAGNFTTAKNSYVGDDLIVFGGSVTLNGTVGKNTKIYASDVVLNGKFSQDVEIRAEKITVSENTEITGKLRYYSDNAASISSNAKISEIEFNEQNYKFAFGERSGKAIFGSFVIALLGLIVLALIINTLLPNFSAKSVMVAYQQSGKSALMGFCYIILTPIAIALLMVTLVGAPIAFMLMSIYIASFFIAGAIAVILTGKLAMNIIRRPSEKITWIIIATGSLVYLLIGLIPVFGWFVKFALVIISMGAIYQSIMPRQEKVEQKKSPSTKLAKKQISKNNASKPRPKK